MLSSRSFAAAFFTITLSSFCCFGQFFEGEGAKSSPTNIRAIRDRNIEMLQEIRQILKMEYFDKQYRGIDIDERFKTAAEKIKTLESHSAIFKTIAQLLLEFNDSHTVLYPPGRSHRLQYGFSMQVIGEDVFVTDVKKGSDAEAKGLRVGDVIRRLGKHDLNRQNLWQVYYYIYYLEPQDRLRILVHAADDTEREMIVMPTVSSPDEKMMLQRERARRKKARTEVPYKCKAMNTELIACRLESFVVEKRSIDKMMTEVQPYKKLILDLRGNGGGYVTIEEYLTGHFFDKEVKIGDMVMRGTTKPRFAKVRKDRGFAGELIVLIDSRSASAAEVFARVVQLEKRGKVVGDTSAGAVMTSGALPLAQNYGDTRFIVYTLNVTVADMIMSDGNRLEHIGVVPDHPVGPSRNALRLGNDPVLAYAARLMGVTLSSADAAKFGFLSTASEFDDEEEDNSKDPNEP